MYQKNGWNDDTALYVLKEWTRWIATWVIAGILTSAILGLLDHDDSDPSLFHKSGLILRTDALTGCQYLVTSGGGIVPRMDANGKQVGCHV